MWLSCLSISIEYLADIKNFVLRLQLHLRLLKIYFSELLIKCLIKKWITRFFNPFLSRFFFRLRCYWGQKASAAIGFIKATDIAIKELIPLKMYLKSFAILKRASIPLKAYSKIIEIFIKAPHF
jgi:hypothetical protein